MDLSAQLDDGNLIRSNVRKNTMPFFPVLGNDRDTIDELFWRVFREDAEEFSGRRVSTPHGVGIYDVYWQEEHRVWGTSSKLRNRYLNAFGFADAAIMRSSDTLYVYFEVNPPRPYHEGRSSGYFLQNKQGDYFIGHNGKFGGGRVRGITIENFKRYCERMGIIWDWENVEMPTGGIRSFIVFGPLHEGGWIEKLARFGRAGYEFKKHLKEQQQNEQR